MIQSPLLYRAACAGAFGRRMSFDGGSISDALFVYLSGIPCAESIAALEGRFHNRPLVCLSAAWEQYERAHHPDAKVFERTMMRPAGRFRLEGEEAVPDGFAVSLFDEDAFRRHPFSHGSNYASFDAFRQCGSGAVVRCEGKIVSAASSFISFAGEVELDVSTEPEYRGRGLACACVSRMLRDCAERGIVVHWDAQNAASRCLAEKFGFEMEAPYSVYWIL